MLFQLPVYQISHIAKDILREPEVTQTLEQQNGDLTIIEDGHNYKIIRNFEKKLTNKDQLEFEIKRYLKTNFFGFKIGYKTNEKKFKYRISVQINNEIVFETEDIDSEKESEYLFYLQHFQLKSKNKKEIKFDDINHVVFAVHKVIYKGKKIESFELRQAVQVLLQKKKIKKNYLVNNEGIIFKTKKIISDKYVVWNYVAFQPIPWSQLEKNNGLYRVYVWNSNKEKVEFDYEVKTQEVTELALEGNKKLETFFELVSDTNTPKTGDIKFLDDTNFDYKKSKTVIGPSSSAYSGYYISPFFSGSLYPKINIQFNDSFKNITLTRKIYISKALFGSKESFFTVSDEAVGGHHLQFENWTEIKAAFYNDVLNGSWNTMEYHEDW